MRRYFLLARHLVTATVLILASFAIALGASAQAYVEESVSPEFDTGVILGLVAIGLLAVFRIFDSVVDRLAADPKQDKWDEIKEIKDKMDPVVALVQDWADPTSQNVPPSPTNPLGTSGEPPMQAG